MHAMSLLRMLKRSLGLYPLHPLWNALFIVQLASVPIREMLTAGKGYDHVPSSQAYPRGGQSEMGWNLGG